MWPFKKITKIEDYPEEMNVHFRVTERDSDYSVQWPLRIGLYVDGREVTSEISGANRKDIERAMRNLEKKFSDYKNGKTPRSFVGCYDRASVS